MNSYKYAAVTCLIVISVILVFTLSLVAAVPLALAARIREELDIMFYYLMQKDGDVNLRMKDHPLDLITSLKDFVWPSSFGASMRSFWSKSDQRSASSVERTNSDGREIGEDEFIVSSQGTSGTPETPDAEEALDKGEATPEEVVPSEAPAASTARPSTSRSRGRSRERASSSRRDRSASAST